MDVRGAAELRVKESDRISALARRVPRDGRRGRRVSRRVPDRGAPAARARTVDAAGDHRLAMAFAIAALRRRRARRRSPAQRAVDVSYPGFFEELERLTTPGDGR